MKIAHSMYTPPLHRRGTNGNLEYQRLFAANSLYYTISALLLRKHGISPVLFCDEEALKVGKIDESLYERVIVLPDERISKLSPRFWASGKFACYAHPEWQSDWVHIDGDVFFLKPDLLEVIRQDKSDVLIQDLEVEQGYEEITRPVKDIFLNQPFLQLPASTAENAVSYNVGVISVRNNELRKKYVDTYFAVAQKMTDCANLAQYHKMTVDLFAEQEVLALLSKKYTTKTLLPDFAVRTEFRENDELGFRHYTGTLKYMPANLKERLELLKTLDAERFNNFRDLLNIQG